MHNIGLLRLSFISNQKALQEEKKAIENRPILHNRELIDLPKDNKLTTIGLVITNLN
uniref:Uncharacterized protein n=1 Tax=Manihot esculenta TaxID=3983 RepID=A0A2C9UD73_MANES